MREIYSKIDDKKIICAIARHSDITDRRLDMCPDSEYLQVCARNLTDITKVNAHKHLPIKRETNITQEAWIVFAGRIKAKFYDIDSSYLYETILSKGDCMVLFRGGHSLESLDRNTVFYEIKTGPYYGEDRDKEFISE